MAVEEDERFNDSSEDNSSSPSVAGAQGVTLAGASKSSNPTMTRSDLYRTSSFGNIISAYNSKSPGSKISTDPQSGRYAAAGSYRAMLQGQNSSGAVGGLASNLSELRNTSIMNSIRFNYGGIRRDSRIGEAMNANSNSVGININNNSGYSLSDSDMRVTDYFTSYAKSTEDFINAVLGKSGVSGNSTGSEVAGIGKAINMMLFGGKNTDITEVLKDKWKSADGKASSTFSNALDAYNAALDSTGKAWKGVIDAAKSVMTDVASSAKAAGSAIGDQLFGEDTDWKNKALAALQYGTFFGLVLKSANILGGKLITYCLGSEDMYPSGYALDGAKFRAKIMNTPPAFSTWIDPCGRFYNNNIIACSHVLSILPGNTDLEGFKFFTGFGISNAAIAAELESFESDEGGSMIFDGTSAIMSIMAISNAKNRRIGIFKPEIYKFLRVYETIMGRLLARLNPQQSAIMALDPYQITTSGWGDFKIMLGQNVTVTESASNSFGESMFDKFLGQASSMPVEISKAITRLTGGKSPSMTSTDSEVEAVLRGQKINTPKFWESSDFNRSYTISLRLESPYGDTASLIQYVYKPFAALLACSLPIYRSTYGFSAPFMVRMDCPGWFTIDTGYVTSIDFRRAPDEGTWSARGLATAIEVTLSVQDFYNSLALSTGPAGLSGNFNERAFIDSMTGMDYKEIYSGGSLAASLRANIIQFRSLPAMVGSAARAKMSYLAWDAPNYILGKSTL